jgi:hypothetical protein
MHQQRLVDVSGVIAHNFRQGSGAMGRVTPMYRLRGSNKAKRAECGWPAGACSH